MHSESHDRNSQSHDGVAPLHTPVPSSAPEGSIQETVSALVKPAPVALQTKEADVPIAKFPPVLASEE